MPAIDSAYTHGFDELVLEEVASIPGEKRVAVPESPMLMSTPVSMSTIVSMLGGFVIRSFKNIISSPHGSGQPANRLFNAARSSLFSYPVMHCWPSDS